NEDVGGPKGACGDARHQERPGEGAGGGASGGGLRRSGTPSSRPRLEEPRFGRAGDAAAALPPTPRGPRPHWGPPRDPSGVVTVRPASMISVCPVTQRASSLAR